MEVFRDDDIQEDHLRVLNLCRLSLQVHHGQDVLTIDGKYILISAKEGHRTRKIRLEWPKTEVPKMWWTMWGWCVTRYIVPTGSHFNPSVSHQKVTSWMSEDG